MNASRVAISRDVLFENLRAEGTLPKRIVEDNLGSTQQVALWQRLFLRQQNPGPIGLSEACIGPAPRFQNRNHIEDGKPLNVFGMIQRHTIRDTSSTIMAIKVNVGKPSLPMTSTNSFAIARFE